MGTGKRPGRPWAPARGANQETNDLVGMVRGWLDDATVSVTQLHRLLTPEHFMAGRVPALRKLREQLAGESLQWDLVEAVADLCLTSGKATADTEDLDLARRLWRQANEAPTPVGSANPDTVPARALLEAQERTIRAYEDMDRARRAYINSEQGRQQALQIAVYLFGMLGQANAKTAELRRRVDALQAGPQGRGELDSARRRLARAEEQETRLRGELARAQQERDTAQQVADLAARRVTDLEGRLQRLAQAHPLGITPNGETLDMHLPTPTASAPDLELDEVDEALHRVGAALDREHETILDAADELGWRARVPGTLQGELVRTDSGAAGGTALFGTTPDNSSAGDDEPAQGRIGHQRAQDRLRFLGAASTQIARGMDVDEIVVGLCRATVPTFADAILVYMGDPLPVGDERREGPAVFRLLRRDQLRPLDQIPAEPTGPHRAGTNDKHVRSSLLRGPHGGLSIPELCTVALDGPLADLLRQVRPAVGSAPGAAAALHELLAVDTDALADEWVLIAPLRGRRRIIGVAVLLRDADRPAFTPEDLVIAAQLASQTALGLDKAVLYGREAYIADELQRTMLPAGLPQPTGVRLASRYLPAAEAARVGGDWYDAIPLPGSRVALVIGDVMGHSITSAAIMGQLQTTARILLQLDLPPAEVLHHLDEQAQRLGADRIATCLYAVYDPVAHRITVANAGHPPPILLHSDGRAEVVRVPPGAPIGVGSVEFEAVELEAPVGATLLLYTDGLVESRLRDVWVGIEQLRERLATTAELLGPDGPPPLEALCDDVLDVLVPGGRDDDIALLAARFDGIEPSDVAYWILDAEDTAPGRARNFARRTLTRWGLEDPEDRLALLVSEVVTNAVRYAERPVVLRLLRLDVLRCEVVDDSPRLPRQRRARETDEGGRGLFLVNRLSQRWGATRNSSGKVVWFELALPEQSATGIEAMDCP
ncbi:SpoIIE family protein phosphatase [Streptomyces spororaveus]